MSLDVGIDVGLKLAQALADSDRLWANLERAEAAAKRLSSLNMGGQTQGLNQATQASVNYTTSLQQIVSVLNQVNTRAQTTNTQLGNLNQQMALLRTNSSQVAAGANNAGSSIERMGNRFMGFVAAYISVRSVFSEIGKDISASLQEQKITSTLRVGADAINTTAKQMEFLRTETDRIGTSFTASAPGYARFTAAARGSGIELKEIQKTFVALSEAARVFAMDQGEVNSVFLAVEQMVSKGVVSMQELRLQLGNALPGAFAIASRAMGLTGQQMDKLVSSGELLTKDFLPKFTAQLAKEFPVGEAAGTAAAKIERMKNALFELRAELGQSAPVGGMADYMAKLFGGMKQAMVNNSIEDATKGFKTDKEFTDFLKQTFPASNPTKDPTYFDVKPSRPGFAVGEAWIEAEGRRLTPKSRAERYLMAERDQQNEADAKSRQNDKLQQWYESAFKFDKEPEPLTDKQDKAAEHMKELIRDISNDGLTGLQKKLQDVDNHTERTIEKFNVLLKTLGEDNFRRKFGDPQEYYDAIFGGADMAKEHARWDDADERHKETTKKMQKEIDDAKELQKVFDKINGGQGEDKFAARRAQANADYKIQFDKINLLRTEETNVEDLKKAMEGIVAIRARELKQIGEAEVADRKRRDLAAEIQAIMDGDVNNALAARRGRNRRVRGAAGDRIRMGLENGELNFGQGAGFGFDEVISGFGNAGEKGARIGEATAKSMESAFTDAFNSIITQTKSVPQAFADMASQIAIELEKVVVKELIVNQLLESLKGLSGLKSLSFGGDNFTKQLNSPSGGALIDYNVNTSPIIESGGFVAHYGGMIGVDGSRRRMPRMHGGGVVGDEMPVIAKRGEAMVPPEMMGAIVKAVMSVSGTHKERPLTIYNGFSDSSLDEAMARNPDMVVNWISARAGSVRTVLGVKG